MGLAFPSTETIKRGYNLWRISTVFLLGLAGGFLTYNSDFVGPFPSLLTVLLPLAAISVILSYCDGSLVESFALLFIPTLSFYSASCSVGLGMDPYSLKPFPRLFYECPVSGAPPPANKAAIGISLAVSIPLALLFFYTGRFLNSKNIALLKPSAGNKS